MDFALTIFTFSLSLISFRFVCFTNHALTLQSKGLCPLGIFLPGAQFGRKIDVRFIIRDVAPTINIKHNRKLPARFSPLFPAALFFLGIQKVQTALIHPPHINHFADTFRRRLFSAEFHQRRNDFPRKNRRNDGGCHRHFS